MKVICMRLTMHVPLCTYMLCWSIQSCGKAKGTTQEVSNKPPSIAVLCQE